MKVIHGTDFSLKPGKKYPGDSREWQVTCIDNYEQAGSEFKQRFGSNACPKQIIAGMGILLCAQGAPFIYYGTEQGVEGNSNGNVYIGDAMFNPDDQSTNVLNQQSYIYREIAAIAALRKREAALRLGKMHFRETSADRRSFHFPESSQGVLAFSRMLFNEEILVVYNSSVADAREEYVLIDPVINKDKQHMRYIYGRHCVVDIQRNNSGDNGARFIKLYLEPKQLVILKSC